jgi:hypothetical protein
MLCLQKYPPAPFGLLNPLQAIVTASRMNRGAKGFTIAETFLTTASGLKPFRASAIELA